MAYKAALFDLDGVVVDTESQYTKFWGSVGKNTSLISLILQRRSKAQHSCRSMTAISGARWRSNILSRRG